MSKKIITIIMTLLIIMTTAVYAYNLSGVGPKPISSLAGTAASVLGVMQWGGYIIAVGMLIWVGIKYVTSGAGEKAKAKETLIPIVIGAVLIAAAVTIAGAIFGAVST
ncbi:MAG: hypothetical protein J6B87_00210 [Clostridia bacterium]|nr:hypothetical protein [Clostridia bacterium]